MEEFKEFNNSFSYKVFNSILPVYKFMILRSSRKQNHDAVDLMMRNLIICYWEAFMKTCNKLQLNKQEKESLL